MSRWRFGAALVVSTGILGARFAIGQTAPVYRAEYLGSALGVTSLSHAGVLVGTTTIGGAERGWVARSGSPLAPLPLPPGRASSRANDVDESGVIVGVVGTGSYADPSFGGTAARWTPNGAGGYTVQELGRLPGHVGSEASALNNVGDVVGYSTNGTYRYPVLFTAPGGVQDLSATGVFDPVAINDLRVLVDQSFTAKRLDLNSMVVQDLGVPTGLPSNYVATRSAAINASGFVAGQAILATSTSCDRVAARFTDGVGWEVFGTCGPGNGVHDLNDLGDFVMRVTLDVYVRLEGVGTYRIGDLVVAPTGSWTLYYLPGMAINNARQIACSGTNAGTGETGILLLTPVAQGAAGVCAGDGTAAACPCGNSGAASHGCANSVNPLGASLAATGTTSLSFDTLVLLGTGMPNSPALYFQGTGTLNGGQGAAFGDGLRCASGAIVRLATRSNVLGASVYPSPGDPPVSVRGGVTSPGPRTYQVWYRNADPLYCTPATFNLTNGLEVTWSS